MVWFPSFGSLLSIILIFYPDKLNKPNEFSDPSVKSSAHVCSRHSLVQRTQKLLSRGFRVRMSTIETTRILLGCRGKKTCQSTAALLVWRKQLIFVISDLVDRTTAASDGGGAAIAVISIIVRTLLLFWCFLSSSCPNFPSGFQS